jgi:hypothetical protein
MRKNLLMIISTASAVFVFGVLSFNVSSAATQPTPACSFKEDIVALEDLKESAATQSTDYLNNIKNELKIRKGILEKIITCSVSEANDLKNQIDQIKADTKNISDLQEKFLTELDQTINYYESQRGAIPDLGILGTKNMAKKLIDWRASSFDYLIERTNYFSTWAKNQNFILAAEDRLRQIKKGVLAVADNNADGEVSKILIEAEKNLEKAQSSNKDAQDSFWGFESTDASLNAIKSTLEALASTYQNFFDLTNVIKKSPLPEKK